MEIPLAQIYVSFSLLSTLAFIYLIYNFFIRDIKNTPILNSSTQEINNINDNIQGIINHVEIQDQKNSLSHTPSSISTVTHFALQNKQSEVIQRCKNRSDRQYNFLPHSNAGLSSMKAINKTYLKNYKKACSPLLRKQKKKNSYNCFVKKYGFHKTTLVTIYEQIEY